MTKPWTFINKGYYVEKENCWANVFRCSLRLESVTQCEIQSEIAKKKKNSNYKHFNESGSHENWRNNGPKRKTNLREGSILSNKKLNRIQKTLCSHYRIIIKIIIFRYSLLFGHLFILLLFSQVCICVSGKYDKSHCLQTSQLSVTKFDNIANMQATLMKYFIARNELKSLFEYVERFLNPFIVKISKNDPTNNLEGLSGLYFNKITLHVMLRFSANISSVLRAQFQILQIL